MRTTVLLLLPVLACTGCSGMSNTGKGALAGGGIGGALGYGVGALAGNRAAGTAIGGGLGALVGAGLGSDKDREERRDQAAAAARAAHPPLTIQDVIYMAHSHTPDDIIINQINTTNSSFVLNPTDITYLQSQGVSPRVIGYMQARRPVAVTPVRHERVYVIEERPPVSVGFGFSSGPHCRPFHHRHCW